MKRKWQSGPPPHVGWWNASAECSIDVWRWWDGKHWSAAVFSEDRKATVSGLSQRKTEHAGIRWNDRWPENARVPRIAP